MATKNVQLPEIGEGVTEGELVNWLVKVGDKVEADQAVAEMMTDKATVEVPTPISGVVKEISLKVGDVVAVGAVMLVLETEGAGASAAPAEKASSAAAPAAASKSAAATPAPALSAASPAQSNATHTQGNPAHGSSPGATHGSSNGMEIHPPVADVRVLATPATRRLAREMNVDINQLRGSGLAGRVTREDVLKNQGAGATAAGQPQYQPQQMPRLAYQGPAGAVEERVPLKGIRKKIAENMQLYKQIVPHFTLMDEVEVTALVKLREDLKPFAEKNSVKITYLPFVMKALIATIREFPMFNASIDDAAQEIVYKKYFNIGFAADTPQGLLVPVIKDADRKSIVQLSAEIVDLAKRARDGKLKPEEMKGATITITNIGSVGGMYATPIINHPEVAILGMYKISDKPVIRDGKLEAIKVMNYTVTCDHRLIDGAVAANFMRAFLARIENPGVLMMDML